MICNSYCINQPKIKSDLPHPSMQQKSNNSTKNQKELKEAKLEDLPHLLPHHRISDLMRVRQINLILILISNKLFAQAQRSIQTVNINIKTIEKCIGPKTSF